MITVVIHNQTRAACFVPSSADDREFLVQQTRLLPWPWTGGTVLVPEIHVNDLINLALDFGHAVNLRRNYAEVAR